MIKADKSLRLHTVGRTISAIILLLSLQGCIEYQYKPEPVNTDSLINEINSWSLSDPGLNAFLERNGVAGETLIGQVFSLKRLYLTGLYFNPEMQTAYRKWEKAQVVTSHPDYRINPQLSIPLEHHSDTSDGKSQWTIGAVLAFIYERKGKREARLADAEVQLLNARLAIEKLAIDSYAGFQMQYQAYVITLAKITETENEVEVLRELLSQLQKKYELGGASQFEISTIELELQQRLFQLSLQKNILQEFKDNLLAMTHLAHTEYGQIEIQYTHPLTLARETYQNSPLFEMDVSALQSGMLENHVAMALQLNTYAQAEARLRLEIEKQYPDIVLSPGFIFDQSDNIWAFGASWILPLFGNSRQNLQIVKALEERKIKQQEVVALQKKLLNSLYIMYQSLLRHKQTIKVSDEIIASIEQRAITIQKQIELGGMDSVALLRNRMEFYKAKQTQTDIYHQAINAMLNIEHLLHHSHIDIKQVVTSWIANVEEKNIDEPAY
ncbi:MAG: TolC family protein [Gammaproteobacteria bacterium]